MVFSTSLNGTLAENMTLTSGGNLEVKGSISIGEINNPNEPSDGDGGILYTKTDGKPYWMSNETTFGLEMVTFASSIPTSTTNTGIKGQMYVNKVDEWSSHLYVCVDTNTWRRATLGTWS